MPKKTIYIRDSDVELWEQAESVAKNGESVSAVLSEALRQYLTGHQTRTAWVRLKGAEDGIRVRVEPAPDGWLIGVPPLASGGTPVLQALKQAGIWIPDAITAQLRSGSAPLWVWIPATVITGLWLITPEGLTGIDYVDLARHAWPRLVGAAKARQTMSYSELGQQLGGLHPLHQVPAVLDVIERWCLTHGHPDLTGVVVSKNTGLPGADFWRQNGWAELPLAERVDRWRQTQTELAAADWSETPPF
ncbi:hypothetical protein TPY_0024 [Sulfobacillus acidophilus TPY]|uniref:Uncharacterized protein n=1 Tax=Sulfobacillus acidophilus (strain ATCC 700253 / DSM 10332 / NAL) TaxID=679936 RepID=G8TV19_SULAD|nr:hypothetical protein TPY_0024 [Sulfobacillus acidophilus TPY]AEW03600.1 hypothetical protein Sulac_0023 [Sulfobacillus acidophilus DSM 10332]